MSKSATSKTVTASPVTWFEVHTGNPERAKAFYGTVFGWTFSDDMPGYSMVGQGEQAAIGGGIASPSPDHQPMAVFNVQVLDVEAACDAVVTAGGKVAVPMQSTNGLEFAYVADPDGSVFGIWTPAPS